MNKEVYRFKLPKHPDCRAVHPTKKGLSYMFNLTEMSDIKEFEETYISDNLEMLKIFGVHSYETTLHNMGVSFVFKVRAEENETKSLEVLNEILCLLLTTQD